jgi:putative transposase
VLKAFKSRIYPTPEQVTLLEKHFGCARWVYNWALAEKSARYIKAGANVSIYELQSHLPELKARPETAWLGEVSAQSLQMALHNLDKAYTAFFKGAGFPRFKSRYDRIQSFQVPQGTRIESGTQRIHFLKFREGIKGCFNRTSEGKIKTTTISRTATGKYYASVLVETPETEPVPPPADESTALGLDFGLKDLVVTSDERRFANPRTLKRYLRRLQIRQRRLSRAIKGSKNRNKARQQVALVHERISNIRTNNLHQISSELTRKNHGVSTLCIEDLNVSGMVKNRRLARSIQDAGWRELRRQLEYKCRWYGINFRVIGRFEPSSKMCSCCGHINTGLTLADRSWTCVCGATHDRDVNAAINIRTMAFREQNTSSTPSGAKDNYRQVRRKVTPVEQPIRAAGKQECWVESHLVT